jgi:hypothetical protein
MGNDLISTFLQREIFNNLGRQKHVFGSSEEYRGGTLPNFCLCVGSHGAGFKLRAKARFDSCSSSEGWCPGATTITNLSWELE